MERLEILIIIKKYMEALKPKGINRVTKIG